MTGVELAIAAAKSPKAAEVFSAAATRLAKAMAGPARTVAIKALAALEGYGSYLTETNERVSTVKTFANPELPVSLLDHFVKMQLRLGENRKPIDQDVLLERVLKPSRIVISATAGYGKSVLMKFFALSLYENLSGRIPIFIELRSLNRVTTPNLLAFINSSYKNNSSVSVEAFRKGLATGAFVLLLDGFDELNHDIRQTLEEQILQIARDFPKAAVVVSGRPDEKFLSWRSFEVYKVCPMSQSSVVDLINKLEFDNGIKKRFVQKIKSGLYETHQSFLSTPLLAILMLLTYKENANIPDKMHLFYSKAFETLFHKHDAMKEQYERKRRTDLQIDEFEKVFSIFCLATYVKEKIEFTQVELSTSIKSAIEFNGYDIKPEDMLFDLEEAVCLLQKEGTSFFFVHRSLQEYFTAVFLSYCPENTRDEFVDQVALRYWDNVLPMLFDMASAQLEPSWVAREADRYLEYVRSHGSDWFAKLSARWKGIGFFKSGDTDEVYNLLQGEFGKFLLIMHRFYPKVLSYKKDIDFYKLRPILQLNNESDTEIKTSGNGSFKVRNCLFSREQQDIYEQAGLIEFATAEYEAVRLIRNGIDTQQRSRNEFLDRLFKSR